MQYLTWTYGIQLHVHAAMSGVAEKSTPGAYKRQLMFSLLISFLHSLSCPLNHLPSLPAQALYTTHMTSQTILLLISAKANVPGVTRCTSARRPSANISLYLGQNVPSGLRPSWTLWRVGMMMVCKFLSYLRRSNSLIGD